jgi:hypothetical protein
MSSIKTLKSRLQTAHLTTAHLTTPNTVCRLHNSPLHTSPHQTVCRLHTSPLHTWPHQTQSADCTPHHCTPHHTKHILQTAHLTTPNITHIHCAAASPHTNIHILIQWLQQGTNELPDDDLVMLETCRSAFNGWHFRLMFYYTEMCICWFVIFSELKCTVKQWKTGAYI